MCSLRLLCAIIGTLLFHGFWGALIGYGIGVLLEQFIISGSSRSGDGNDPWTGTATGNARGGASGYNRDERRQQHAPTSRDEFLQSLLLLSAHIIQADGKIMHSEMECVRRFWSQNFGIASVNDANNLLMQFFEQRKQTADDEWQLRIRRSCARLTQILTSEARSQLISFLCSIATADGNIDRQEVTELKRIAVFLGFDDKVIEQLLNLGNDSLEAAYKVLGVSPDASDDEVKRAYRKMALQYHPDKVATLGDDVRAAAEKKFKEIGAAKDKIWAARGL